MVSADNIIYQKGRPDLITAETKYKDADESVSSSTTYQDDNDLTGFEIVQDTWYKIEGLLMFDAAANGPGVKLQFVSSASVGDYSAISLFAVDTSSNIVADVGESASGTTLTPSTFTGTLQDDQSPTFMVRGAIKGNASASATLKLQWAQASSSANAVTLRAGSWVTLSKLASLN